MKLVMISLIFLSRLAVAEGMSKEQIQTLGEEASSFKADCLETVKINKVKELNIKNKTSEHMDKTILSTTLNKNLGLTVSPKGKHILDVEVQSSSSEKDKMRKTEYTLHLSLKDATKEVCKQSYTLETSESL